MGLTSGTGNRKLLVRDQRMSSELSRGQLAVNYHLNCDIEG